MADDLSMQYPEMSGMFGQQCATAQGTLPSRQDQDVNDLGVA